MRLHVNVAILINLSRVQKGMRNPEYAGWARWYRFRRIWVEAAHSGRNEIPWNQITAIEAHLMDGEKVMGMEDTFATGIINAVQVKTG